MDRLIETRHAAAVDFRDVTLAGAQQLDDPNRWLFLPQSSGGSITLPSRSTEQPGNQLYWSLHNHTVSTLTLAEVSLTSGHVGRGVRLQIPGQVFPAIACSTSGETCCLLLLLSNRTVGVLQLQPPRQQQRSSISSILDSVQPRSLLQIQLSQQLASLGAPTALAAVDGHLCIAGSEGSVVCLPLTALTNGQQPAPGAVLHLNPNNFVVQVRRRMGFAANSGVIAAVPVDLPAAGHKSLLVIHEDTSCHQWFLNTARQGLSQTLVADASARQLCPNRVLLCYAPTELPRSSTPWDVLLVWDMGLADSSGHSDVRVMPFKLQAAAGGSNSSNAKLEPQLPQPQQLQLEWPDASLVDAKVDGQQLLLLCSIKGGGPYVVSYSLNAGFSYQGRCQLLQQRVSSEWGIREEMWSCAMSALHKSSAGGAAARQVLGQLLVPGQVCLSSLVAALAYHGAQMTEGEAAAASLSQLQARITAAVELIKAKYPAYSTARCWHTLFASYCEYWQQQHSVVALYAAPGGWLGIVREGGLLSVLRKPSLSEVLLTESSEASLNKIMQAAGVSASDGGPGGARSLAKVRLCLSTLGDLLGQPAMRVMTQAVMSGVSVEGELLPHMVELLLQGPPTTTSSSSSGAGGSVWAASVQQRLSEWRLQRQSQLLFVQEQLGELTDALATLNEFAKLAIKTAINAAAQLQSPTAAAADATPHTGPQVGTLLSTMALHSTRAACSTLQQLLLLLGCIQRIGCVGATPLTAADQAAISTDLLPPLTTALRSAAVVLWLCKTPASCPVRGMPAAAGSAGAGVGPLWGLRNPTPTGTPAGTPRGDADSAAAVSPGWPDGAHAGRSHAGGVGVTAAVWQQPLAAHLLPQFMKQQGLLQQHGRGLGSELGSMGDQLAVWLMLGADAATCCQSSSTAINAGDANALDRITGRRTASSSAAAVAAAVESSEGLAGRGVLLGYQLFLFREYEAMQRLVRLIGGRDPSEAGLQFILGLSIACGIKTAQGAGLTAEQRAAQLESAVGHLFRAAAGLCSEEAAPLRLVLQLLRQRQGSCGSDVLASAAVGGSDAADMEADGGDQVVTQGGHHENHTEDVVVLSYQAQAEARLRLQFCQAVLLLFEREGVTQGAMAFARAALGAVDAAYLPHQHQEKIQQQAALWTSVFNCASELDLNHEAYTAALSNPIPERAAESARRLVQALVDRGQLQQLLSLPWSGVIVLKRQGLKEPVPVVELVIDKLTRRALHSELSLQPNAHQVLFDFLVAWGNYKAAAAAMLSYARRLRASLLSTKQRLTAEIVEEVTAAYAASTAMLQLLAPADAWLDPDQTLLAPFPAPAPRTSANSTTAAAALPGLGSLAGMSQQLPVISLPDLKQEAALFSASVLLLQHLPGLDMMQYGLAADYIVEQLLGAREFAAAVELIHTMWEGPEQQGRRADKLETVAFALAAACVKLQQSDSAADGGLVDEDMSGEGLGSFSQGVLSYTGPGFLDSTAAAAWQKLRQLLKLYDTGSTNRGTNGNAAGGCSSLGGRLRLAAVDGALSTQPAVQLPAWLLQPFQPVPGAAGGMAGSGADPAGLLRVLMKHGRLVDAAQFVKDHLEAWQTQNALLRAQPCAVWLPQQVLELLHASLVAGAARAGSSQRVAEAEVLGTWSEVLEAGLADHVALVKSDAGKLGVGVRSGGVGRYGGPLSMVF